MNLHIFSRVFVLASLLVQPLVAQPCTTFLASDGEYIFLGKSYDWHIGSGYLLVNHPNVAKGALPTKLLQNPAKWVSKYGSITFNQHGRELPLGGMNTQKLVVEVMWLNESEYPAPNGKPDLNELQFIQYMLDTSANVEEAIAQALKVRVVRHGAPVHYMICDASKTCATLEYIKGSLVINYGTAMQTPVLTNDTYSTSSKELDAFLAKDEKGNINRPLGHGSLARFVRTAFNVREFKCSSQEIGQVAAFSALDDVKNDVRTDYTKWNIVYDLKSGKIAYRSLARPEIKWVHIDDFTYSCKKPAKMLSMNADAVGHVSEKFEEYSVGLNLDMIQKSLKGQQSDQFLKLIAAYPEKLPCMEK